MADNPVRARTLLNLLIARKTAWNEEQLWSALNHIRCLLAESESATEKPAMADLWHDAGAEEPPIGESLLVYAKVRVSNFPNPVYDSIVLAGKVLEHTFSGNKVERVFVGGAKAIYLDDEDDDQKLILWQELALPIPMQEAANETVGSKD